jgi:hypothetical protein
MTSLTKDQAVMKALIEATLMRNRRPHNPDDVHVMLTAMSAIIKDEIIYVYADSSRFTDDFSMAIRRRCQHIGCLENVKSLDKCNLVILLTGTRTIRQQESYDALLNILAFRPNITRWRIGDWRA